MFIPCLADYHRGLAYRHSKNAIVALPTIVDVDLVSERQP